MPGNACERCGATVPGESYELYDYCAICFKNLCSTCMEKGCCGNVPAQSGMEADFEDEVDPKAEESPGNGSEARV